MNKTKITIGIPAHNEEANIKFILSDIFIQKETIFKIKDIVVALDDPQDNTEKVVRKIKNKKLKIISNEKRLGKSQTQNKILKYNKNDIVVLLDADIRIPQTDFIEKLISPILNDSKVGLVASRIEPLKNNNILGNIIYLSALLKQELFEHLEKNNLYFCVGRARAFSKEFIKKINWPPTISEDAYSYLFAKSKHFKFVYVPQAKVLYRLPQTLKDHLRQSKRYIDGNLQMKQYFSNELVEAEYYIPAHQILRFFFLYLIKFPKNFVIYISIYLYSRILFSNKGLGPIWTSSSSTKEVSI